jgi:hypothetical protein
MRFDAATSTAAAMIPAGSEHGPERGVRQPTDGGSMTVRNGLCVSLPWNARWTFGASRPPSSLALYLVLYCAWTLVGFAERWGWLDRAVAIIQAGTGRSPVVEWGVAVLVAVGSVLTMHVIVVAVPTLVWRMSRPERSAARAGWVRERPSAVAAWLCGVARFMNLSAARRNAREWPGPGLIVTGYRGLSLPVTPVLPAEGE